MEEHRNSAELAAITNSAETKSSKDNLNVQGDEIKPIELRPANESVLLHVKCLAQLQEQRLRYEQQIEELHATSVQKDDIIALHQRENAILEKEKRVLFNEKELANKEKESTVIKFAMKEKLLIDAKKEKDAIDKQLADARKEIKCAQARFQAVNEEKSRLTYVFDEKCNEVRKYKRECEKLKSEMQQLESKLKYHINRLNIEFEAKTALERKLEEERNASGKLEEKANEKLRLGYEANTILLRHEIASKTESLDNLTREYNKAMETLNALQQELQEEKLRSEEIYTSYSQLQEEHFNVQAVLSDEMLNSVKLREQLEEFQVLLTRNSLNEEKLRNLQGKIEEYEKVIEEYKDELQSLRIREAELLSTNKEMSECFVKLQSEVNFLKNEIQAINIENNVLKQEKEDFDEKYRQLEKELKTEINEKNEERVLLTRHISEKTKSFEITRDKLDNLIGEFEAAKNKHSAVVKELQRELQKYKSIVEKQPTVLIKNSISFNDCHNNTSTNEAATVPKALNTPSCNGSIKSVSASSSDIDIRVKQNDETKVENLVLAVNKENELAPSKKQLIERILRLQQASRRQTEKIEFLENHTMALLAELQKKSKLVQYYTLSDKTAGALTSSKSDEHKSELAKYGNGVMSAIYNGLQGEKRGMTLELSLEINRKLQTVLEDTLLKNITLKENLDVLGQEVHNLTRKLRQLEAKAV